jgi:transcriptional regulator with XRE-family HTH domain
MVTLLAHMALFLPRIDTVSELKSLENRAMAAAIRAERSAAGLSQETLAKLSGVNYETLKRILKGDRDINITQISGIALAVGITPAQLVQRAEERLRVMVNEELSEGASTTDDITRKRLEKEAEARSMTIDQLAGTQNAATDDPELLSDEPEAP